MTVCEYCGRSGLHPECEHQAAEAIRIQQAQCAKLASKFALHGSYGIVTPESEISLSLAEKSLHAYLGELPAYDAGQLIEGDRWWFIPVGWIGMTGFVVEKTSQKIFPLGSGLVALHVSPAWPVPWCAIREYLVGNVPAARMATRRASS